MATVIRPLTLEEFLRLPEEKPALEFEDGEVTQKVSPKAKHSRLQLAVCTLINGFAEPRKLALAFPEMRATFGGRSYVPDVSVYRWDRIALDGEGEPVDDVVTPPDIAVEIVSPGQSVNRLIRRCLWYVENGVSIALLIDPADRSVLRQVAGQPPQPLSADDLIDFGGILPGLDLPVEQLFAALKLR